MRHLRGEPNQEKRMHYNKPKTFQFLINNDVSGNLSCSAFAVAITMLLVTVAALREQSFDLEPKFLTKSSKFGILMFRCSTPVTNERSCTARAVTNCFKILWCQNSVVTEKLFLLYNCSCNPDAACNCCSGVRTVF